MVHYITKHPLKDSIIANVLVFKWDNIWNYMPLVCKTVDAVFHTLRDIEDYGYFKEFDEE